MEEANKYLIRRMLERVDAEGEEAYAEFLAPDVVFHLSEGIAETKMAFTGVKHTIEDLIAEGDKVVANFTINAVHTGEFMDVLPTNKNVTFTTIGIYRIADAKVVEGWFYFDALGLLKQIRE